MTVFFEPHISTGIRSLSEEESKHCYSVLRHKVGDEIILMDGIGTVMSARLSSVGKKICEFEELERKVADPKSFRIHLGIAPTKNVDRMEWMVEKLGEIGVDEITFLKAANSERSKIRIDRLKRKALSAMKQSKYPFLLQINELTTLNDFLTRSQSDEKWIAHVGEHPYLADMCKKEQSVTLLIGPEGDFSLNELELAQNQGFRPISLGTTTLRTETAGLMACHFVNVVNGF